MAYKESCMVPSATEMLWIQESASSRLTQNVMALHLRIAEHCRSAPLSLSLSLSLSLFLSLLSFPHYSILFLDFLFCLLLLIKTQFHVKERIRKKSSLMKWMDLWFEMTDLGSTRWATSGACLKIVVVRGSCRIIEGNIFKTNICKMVGVLDEPCDHRICFLMNRGQKSLLNQKKSACSPSPNKEPDVDSAKVREIESKRERERERERERGEKTELPFYFL